MKSLIKKYILPFSIFTLLLLPLLFTVLSNDISIFYKVARIMLNGGALYHDCYDMKPPSAYIICAAILFVLGKSPLSILFAGYLWALVTSCAIFIFVEKTFHNRFTSYISSIFYITAYLSLDWNDHFQLESMILFPLACSMWIFLKKDKTVLWNVLFGAIIGFIISCKYTFVFILFPFIIFDIIYHSFSIKNYIIYTVSSATAFILWHFPLLNPDSFHGWRMYMELLSSYSNYHPFSMFFLKECLGSFETVFLKYTSPFFVILFVISVYYYIKNHFDSDTGKIKLYVLNSLIFIAFFVSIVIEKKLFIYHYSRLFLCASIFVGFGAYYFYNEILKNLKYKKTQAAIIIFIMILISPIPKASLILEPFFYKITGSAKFIEFYGRYDNPLGRVSDFYKIMDTMKKNDRLDYKKTMIVSITTSMFNIVLDNCEFSRFGSPQFYLSENSSVEWKYEALEEFKKADWIIAQSLQTAPALYGHFLTPYDALIADTILSPEINNFRISFKTSEYTILERIIVE